MAYALGMFPVGDFLRRRTTPYVNWALIALNVAVFVYMLTLSTAPDSFLGPLRISEADRFIFDYGFVPACIADYFGISTSADPRDLALVCPSSGDRNVMQLFTSMFVHGGWAHIVGNMLFLWIFGDNVEDRMGHGRYLLFYLITGLVAALTQTFIAPETVIPTVGASGAIAGVLGAYFILYPTAMVQVVVFPLIFLPFFVPAIVLIGFWFVSQLFSGFAEIASNTTAGSGVAFWAHIGGFIAGAILVWFFKKRQRVSDRAYIGFD
jgi:membrane associated rhomboid family serine protease